VILLTLSLLLAACGAPSPTPPPTPALVRVLATDLTEPLAWDLALAYTAERPAVVVAPSLAPAGALAAELGAGRAELALVVEPALDPALFATPLGRLPWAVVAHPANPIAELSLDQARALFAGQLADWAALGGQGPVAVAARAEDSDAGRAFAGLLWGGVDAERVTAAARLAPTWEAMRAQVAEDPAALGYLLGPLLDDSVKPLRLLDAAGDPLARGLLVVAAATAEPAGPAREFLAWAQSPAGQAVVAERHGALGVE
jgi:phosphate transport system substrate-binding protein